MVINVSGVERALSTGAPDSATFIGDDHASFRYRGSANVTSRFASIVHSGKNDDQDRERMTGKRAAASKSFVHKSPVPTRDAPITKASAHWKYSAKDLWTEECFKQEFLRSVKHNVAYP